MRSLFCFKESFYSFVGGIIASIASTILYEAINNIGTFNNFNTYLLEWISGITMCISCICLLALASNLETINYKLRSILNSKRNLNEQWLRAVRAIAEENMVSHSNIASDEYETIVANAAKKICTKLVTLLVFGILTFVLALAILIMSKVV